MIRDSAYIWIGPLTAMVVAQLLKPLLIMIQSRGWDWKRMRQSGGMPSSHTALVVALVTELWLRLGGRNPVLGLALFVAFIVMYDAAGVRWQTGRQAAVLNRLLHDIRVSNQHHLGNLHWISHENEHDHDHEHEQVHEGSAKPTIEEQIQAHPRIRPLPVAKAPWWLIDWPILDEHVGHKPIEVLGGGIVGLLVALYLH